MATAYILRNHRIRGENPSEASFERHLHASFTIIFCYYQQAGEELSALGMSNQPRGAPCSSRANTNTVVSTPPAISLALVVINSLLRGQTGIGKTPLTQRLDHHSFRLSLLPSRISHIRWNEYTTTGLKEPRCLPPFVAFANTSSSRSPLTARPLLGPLFN